MKKTIIALVATMMMTSIASAQDNEKKGDSQPRHDKTEMVKKRTEQMVEAYGLDEKQAEQLLKLNTEYADKLGGPGRRPHHHGRPGGQQRPPRDGQARPSEGQHKRPELTEEQKAKWEAERKEREANEVAYETELQKVLTPEQYKAYEADKAKRQQHQGQARKRGKKE